MDNKNATASHPFWSLTPEALAAQAAPAIPASHGSECIRRSCASGAYASLLETSDYQRHEIARLRDELAKTQKQAAVEKYKRLTLEIAKAVRTGDKARWSAAVGERLTLGVAVMQEVEGM